MQSYNSSGPADWTSAGVEGLQADFGQYVDTRLNTQLGTQVRKPFVAPKWLEFWVRFLLCVFPRSVGLGLVSSSRGLSLLFPGVPASLAVFLWSVERFRSGW